MIFTHNPPLFVGYISQYLGSYRHEFPMFPYDFHHVPITCLGIQLVCKSENGIKQRPSPTSYHYLLRFYHYLPRFYHYLPLFTMISHLQPFYYIIYIVPISLIKPRHNASPLEPPQDWLDQPPERVLLLTGHRGNGLNEMMTKLIGRSLRSLFEIPLVIPNIADWWFGT